MKKITTILILLILGLFLMIVISKFPFIKFIPVKMQEGFRNELVPAPELLVVIYK